MGMIRRAIVRAAPTCTLWRESAYGDYLAFRPAIPVQHFVMKRIAWSHPNQTVRRLALRLGSWMRDAFAITRQELEDAQR